jgi:hypothetical protein
MSFLDSAPADAVAPEPVTTGDRDHHDEADTCGRHPDLEQVDRLIGAAVGIIMVQRELSYSAAGAVLRDLARQHGRTLHDLAADVTAIGWKRPLRLGSGRSRARPRTGVEGTHPRLDESVAGQVLDLLVETTDLGDLLGAVTELAVQSVPGCESASITMIRDGAPATVASSDARALNLDETQYSEGEGPCLQAVRTDSIVRVDDLAAATPGHPAWRVAATKVGVNGTLSVPIAADANIAAALNLYTGARTGWPEHAQFAAEALATYAGDAITLSYRLASSSPHDGVQ